MVAGERLRARERLNEAESLLSAGRPDESLAAAESATAAVRASLQEPAESPRARAEDLFLLSRLLYVAASARSRLGGHARALADADEAARLQDELAQLGGDTGLFAADLRALRGSCNEALGFGLSAIDDLGIATKMYLRSLGEDAIWPLDLAVVL